MLTPEQSAIDRCSIEVRLNVASSIAYRQYSRASPGSSLRAGILTLGCHTRALDVPALRGTCLPGPSVEVHTYVRTTKQWPWWHAGGCIDWDGVDSQQDTLVSYAGMHTPPRLLHLQGIVSELHYMYVVCKDRELTW